MKKIIEYIFPLVLCLSLIVGLFIPQYSLANTTFNSFDSGKVKIEMSVYNYNNVVPNYGKLFTSTYDSVSPFSRGCGGNMSDTTISRPFRTFFGGCIAFYNSDNSIMFSNGSTLDFTIPDLQLYVQVNTTSSHSLGAISGYSYKAFNSDLLSHRQYFRTYAFITNMSGSIIKVDISDLVTYSVPASGRSGNSYFDMKLSGYVLPCDVKRIEFCIVSYTSNFLDSPNQYIGDSNYTVFTSFTCNSSFIDFLEVSSVITDNFDGLNENISGLPIKISNALSGFFADVVEAFLVGYDTLSSNFSNIISSLKTTLNSSITSVSTNITTMKDNLLARLDTVKSGIVDKLTTVQSNIVSSLTTVSTNITTMKDNLLSRLDTVKSGIVDSLSAVGTKIDTMKTNIVSNLSTVSTNIATMKDNLLTRLNEVKSGIVEKLGNVGDSIVSLKDNTLTKLTEVKNGIVDKLKSVSDFFSFSDSGQTSLNEFNADIGASSNEMDSASDSISGALDEDINLDDLMEYAPNGISSYSSDSSFDSCLDLIVNFKPISIMLCMCASACGLGYIFFGKR